MPLLIKNAPKGNMYFAGQMTSVDILLPAYNPLPGWEDVVIARFHSIGKQLPGCLFTLVVVNDGSSTLDEKTSKEKLTYGIPGFQFISYLDNKGKGYALREGVKQCQSEIIVYTDIDWPYTDSSIVDVIQALLKGNDAAIGVRDEKYYKHLPPARSRISKLLKKFNAGILRLKVNDTQAGLKGFQSHLKSVFLSTTINRYLFDLEFIYLLSRRKDFRIISVPITLREGITFSKMNRAILFEEAKNFLKIWLKL